VFDSLVITQKREEIATNDKKNLTRPLLLELEAGVCAFKNEKNAIVVPF
jgi:hypothetical protein